MATDIKLDKQGGDWLIVEGRVLKTTASDFILDSPGASARRSQPFQTGSGSRCSGWVDNQFQR